MKLLSNIRKNLVRARKEAEKYMGTEYTDALDKDFVEWVIAQGYTGDTSKIPQKYVKKYLKKINPKNYTRGVGWWKKD